MKKCILNEIGTRYNQKLISTNNPEQNILRKVRNGGKIGEYWKTFIPALPFDHYCPKFISREDWKLGCIST